VVKDNILNEVTVGGGSATIAEQDYNLIGNDSTVGAHDLRGTPSYSGGGAPSSYAGFALGTASLGRANASDGTNRGINAGAGATPPGPSPAPAPSPLAPPATPREDAPGVTLTTVPGGDAGDPMTLMVPRRIRWAHLMHGVRVRVGGGKGRMRLTLKRSGVRRLVASRRVSLPTGTRSLVVRPRHGTMGRRRNCTLVVRISVARPGASAHVLAARIRVRR
jgi:hypothetical protein